VNRKTKNAGMTGTKNNKQRAISTRKTHLDEAHRRVHSWKLCQIASTAKDPRLREEAVKEIAELISEDGKPAGGAR
jgi:hypothetical protein